MVRPSEGAISIRRFGVARITVKEEVPNAQTDEAFDRAERKMRLLCAD